MTRTPQQTLPNEKDQDKNLVSTKYSDITLNSTLSYISQILLEEDREGKDNSYHEKSALSEMEKHLSEILGQKYPCSENKEENLKPLLAYPNSIDHGVPYQHNSGNLDILLASEFNKGVEEGLKFLPCIDKLVHNFQANKLSSASTCEQDDDLFNFDIDGVEEGKDKGFMRFGSKGKKKSNIDLDHLEGRNPKISMSYFEEAAIRNTMLDKVLLQHENHMQEVSNLQEVAQSNTSKCCEHDQLDVVDVKNLLIQCAYAVYANDHKLAEELINQIRNRSSLDGDGTQRMAFMFADALAARLTGTGSEAWRRISAKRFPTLEALKICQIYITVCPFPRTSIYYANQTILNFAEKEAVLHIIDLGIGFGFQWPSLIQALSNQNRKKVKLRITGVHFPRPGFRPAELVEETGRRLEDYARSFGIPFEYHGIASKWEDISLDDLRINKDEVLIVNSLYRFREVGDEAVSLDSPRDRVLNLIYQMKPRIFIEGILTATSFSPFFLTRFRQGLILYSALFEVLDTLIPRENKQRQFVEGEIFARDIHNVIACEGSDWIMKPESYKQWHQRNLRAGFEQIPLDPIVVKECREKFSKFNKNKIFSIEEERNWLLQGWSGRMFYALSTWKPKFA